MAPTTLLDLPSELVTMIVSKVETFDNAEGYNESFSFFHKERKFRAFSDLAAISATCKTLRAIAEPILYRAPVVSRWKQLSLLRTLAENPDLAAHVRALDLGIWHLDLPETINWLGCAAIKSIANRLKLPVMKEWVSTRGIRYRKWVDVSVQDLMLALVANSVELVRYTPDAYIYHKKNAFENANINFPRLRFLSIAPGRDLAGSCHAQLYQAKHFRNLTDRCPKLQDLRLGYGGSLSLSQGLANLKTLRLAKCDFDSCGPFKRDSFPFEDFTRLCPNLEDIGIHGLASIHGLNSLRWTSDTPLNWLTQAPRWLEPYKETLKHLYLMPTTREDICECDDILDSMDGFQNLETLTVNPRSFVSLGLGVVTEPSVADCERLLSKLPKNVKYLALPDNGYGWSHPILFAGIAEAVKSNMFPKLRKVALSTACSIDYKDPDNFHAFKKVGDDLRAAGVTLYTIDWPYACSRSGASLGGPPGYNLEPGSNFLKAWPNTWAEDETTTSSRYPAWRSYLQDLEHWEGLSKSASATQASSAHCLS